MNSNILRVAAGSRTNLVAGAIAGQVREKGYSEAQAIGMTAAYCMLKAVIIAQQFVTDDGLRLSCVPEFTEAVVDNQTRTALRLTISTHQPGAQRSAPVGSLAPVVRLAHPDQLPEG